MPKVTHSLRLGMVVSRYNGGSKNSQAVGFGEGKGAMRRQQKSGRISWARQLRGWTKGGRGWGEELHWRSERAELGGLQRGGVLQGPMLWDQAHLHTMVPNSNVRLSEAPTVSLSLSLCLYLCPHASVMTAPVSLQVLEQHQQDGISSISKAFKGSSPMGGALGLRQLPICAPACRPSSGHSPWVAVSPSPNQVPPVFLPPSFLLPPHLFLPPLPPRPPPLHSASLRSRSG